MTTSAKSDTSKQPLPGDLSQCHALIEEVTRTVTVQDTQAPAITLLGGAFVTLRCGTFWPGLWVNTTDHCDGNLSASVIAAGTVDTSLSGTYTLTYNVTDGAGNAAPQMARTVIVDENCEEGEGQGVADIHTADTNGDHKIDLQELLRVIQFFNLSGYACDANGTSEDGYAPGPGSDYTCERHASDFELPAWTLSLQELLRSVQFFNIGGYHTCPELSSADG